MKTNSNFRCGLPSSRKLHNPEVRRLNRMEAKAKAILLARKKEKSEQERQAELKRRAGKVEVKINPHPITKPSFFKRAVNYLKNRKVF